ncbi:preprotein translocase subunit SecA [Candidatus Nomurabacteria bacterium]|nr:preprotein translocase subunit SecA [Candidatus Nomurabacteria bacterium]
MFDFITGIFDSNEKQLKKVQPIIDQINDLEPKMKALSDEELLAITTLLRERVGVDLETARTADIDPEAEKKALMEILPEAFAAVRESADRVAQHRHFDVQLLAGYFLADKKIIELFTGEGKTNAATLAMYLYGLSGRGAHLVTVNDYLARRDGEWNGHVLSALGMSVGVINSGTQYRFITDEEAIALKGAEIKTEIDERKKLQKDVGRLKLDMMSGTNLIECSKSETYACDVVYGTNNEFGFDYLRDNMSQRLSDRVQSVLHYSIVDEADSILIDEARTPLIISQSAQASNDMYKQFATIARSLQPEVHYTVDEKSNSVAITDEGIDQVEKALGVSNVYDEPQNAYHLENALKAKELYIKDDEYIIRDGEIVIVDEFTGRALPGRRYSEGLHQAIEAKEGVEVKRESKTLATVTLQNYFRLYEHLAGMTATALTEAEEFSKVYELDVVVIPTNRPVVRKDENDVVYRTEMGKFKAIVQDIKEANNVGQPVLVGTTSVERSEILSMMLQKEGITHEVLNAKQHEREAKIVQKAGQKGQVTIATNMAGRGTDIALGEGVKEVGGLYVIGSERHESRRIDNQLRGRSGRQGDPGRSRFYVSFEDELMRLFGGDRMQKIMSTVGMDDDMPISIGILGRSIENAQKKVESHNFDIRKRLVDYDDVLNQQREIVYSLRRRVLELVENRSKQNNQEIKFERAKLAHLDIVPLLEDLDAFSLRDPDSWEISGLDQYEALDRPIYSWILKRFVDRVRVLVATHLADDMKIDNVEERKIVNQMIALISEELSDSAIKALGYKDTIEFFRELDGKEPLEMENLLLKLTVSAFIIHIYQIGPAYASEMSRLLVLQTIDQYWMEHLDSMADLREGVGMQSYAQRDPLVAYKNEGFGLFEKMLSQVDEAVVNRYMKVRIVERTAQSQPVNTVHEDATTLGKDPIQAPTQPPKTAQNRISSLPITPNTGVRSDNRPGAVSKQHTVVNTRDKIGRNDLCPCGSGKKYKKCHIGKDPSTPEEKKAFNLYFADREAWETEYVKDL